MKVHYLIFCAFCWPLTSFFRCLLNCRTRFWWVCWKQIRMWWITFSGEKRHSELIMKKAYKGVIFDFSWCHPALWITGVQTCCRLRSPSTWASAAPPVTPTSRPAARCPLTTTTLRWWVSGELNRAALMVSSLSAFQDSIALWGRWPAGTESLELKAGAPKVNFSPKSPQSRF